MSVRSKHPLQTRSATWRPTVEALEDRTVPTAMVAVTNANELFLFNSETPALGRIVLLQGMLSGETLRAIDYRPTAGYLLGVSSNNNFYRIEVNSGQTLREATNLAVPDGGEPDADADVDPISGQMRIVTAGVTFAQVRAFNYRIDFTVPSFPVAVDQGLHDQGGQVVQTIAGLAYLPGGGNPYLIDVGADRLARLEPSTGLVMPGGNLGVNTDVASFDIDPNGTAFAMLGTFSNNTRKLYTINLAQGNAIEIGPIGVPELRGIITEIATLGARPAPEAPPPTPVLGDVTGMVDAVAVKVKPKKGMKKRVERWTFTNTGATPILAPLRLIVERLNGKIKLLNQAGALKLSKNKIEPYQTWNGGTLAAGQSVTFTLEFSVPDGVGLRYGWRLTAGGV